MTIHRLVDYAPPEPRNPARSMSQREWFWLFLIFVLVPVETGIVAAFFAWLMGWW